MIVRALSEMSVELPKAGAFSYYATRYWSKRAGFISGWNYWFNYILVSMVELSVVGKSCKLLVPGDSDMGVGGRVLGDYLRRQPAGRLQVR